MRPVRRSPAGATTGQWVAPAFTNALRAGQYPLSLLIPPPFAPV